MIVKDKGIYEGRLEIDAIIIKAKLNLDKTI